MGTATAVHLYETLKTKLGEGEARDLVDYLSTLEEGILDRAKTELATKADLAGLRQATKADLAEFKQATKADLTEFKQATKADLAELKQATKAGLAELKLATKADLAELKAELIKWMFIFWAGQFASLVAILFLFFK